jgi:hypothetical protein
MYPVVLIAGPTRTGKTDVAVRAAARSGAILLPIDQLQLYMHLEVGVGLDRFSFKEIDTFGYQILDPWMRFSPAMYVSWLRSSILNFASKRPVVIEGGCTSYLKELMRGAQTDVILGAVKIVALRADSDQARRRARIEQFCSTERIRAIVQEVESLRRAGFYDETGLELFQHCEKIFRHPEFYHSGLAWALRISARIYYPAHLTSVAAMSEADARARIMENIVQIQEYQEKRLNSILKPSQTHDPETILELASGLLGLGECAQRP